MSDSIRGNDGYPSLKMTEEEVRKRQRKTDGKTVHEIDRDEAIEERIAKANVVNRRQLPSHVPQEEEQVKDDDLVKLATEEDVRKIRILLKKVELRLLNIEEFLRKKNHKVESERNYKGR